MGISLMYLLKAATTMAAVLALLVPGHPGWGVPRPGGAIVAAVIFFRKYHLSFN